MSKPRKFKEGIALLPVSADPSSPVEGQLQRSDGTARAEGIWEYKSGAWNAIISGSDNGLEFSAVTTATTMVANKGYIITAPSTEVVLTLPSTMAVGDRFSIVGYGAAGWSLVTNASATAQSLYYLGDSTATSSSSVIELANSSQDWGQLDLIVIKANEIVAPKFQEDAFLNIGIPYYSGISAHWKMDETSGNLTDSFSTNTQTAVNTPTYSTEGIFSGGSYTFPSTTLFSGAHSTNLGSTGSTKITIECWMKFTAATATAQIVFMNTASTAYTESSTSLHISIRDSGTGTDLLAFGGTSSGNQARYTYTSKIDDEWHYVVCVYDNSAGANARRIYVDGVSVASNSDVSASTTASGYIAIGGQSTATTSFTTGKINEVVYWKNEAMTSTQITARYNSGTGKPYY